MATRRAARVSPHRTISFVSYAHADGLALTEAIARYVERHAKDQIELWRDHEEMRAGDGWHRQAANAIERADNLLLIVTPDALASPYVQRELEQAWRMGRRVVPVARNIDATLLARLPTWLRQRHILDFAAVGYRPALIEQLRDRTRVRRVPQMAPRLSRTHVERSTLHGKLKSMLLAAVPGVPIAACSRVSGAGGFGKTTLAAAVARDPEVVAHFVDGILWITLGRTSSVQTELARLSAAVTGTWPSFVDTADAIQQATQILADGAYLIVIDDVWSMNDLRACLAAAGQNAVLITTRDNAIGGQFSSLMVEEMTMAEAASLIAAHEAASAEEADRVEELCRRLGRMPLLLNLAGAMLHERVRRGTSRLASLTHLMATLDRRGITGFDHRNAQDRQDALDITLSVSLGLLTREEIACYLDFAIFRRPDSIPAKAISHLCAQHGLQADDLIETLERFSLVAGADFESPSVRMHDALHQYCVGKRREELSAIHARFIDAFGITDWTLLPRSAAFIWDDLCYHLVRAGRWREAVTLVAASSRWLVAKHAVTSGHASFADDVAFLLDEWDRAPEKTEIDLVRLSGAHLLVGDSAAQVPSDAIRAMAALDRVGPALSIVRLLEEPDDQVRGLLVIYSELLKRDVPDAALLVEAKRQLARVVSPHDRIELLADLAAALYHSQRPDEALEHFETACQEAINIDLSASEETLDRLLQRLIECGHVVRAATLVSASSQTASPSALAAVAAAGDHRLAARLKGSMPVDAVAIASLAWGHRTRGDLATADRLMRAALDSFTKAQALHTNSEGKSLMGESAAEMVQLLAGAALFEPATLILEQVEHWSDRLEILTALIRNVSRIAPARWTRRWIKALSGCDRAIRNEPETPMHFMGGAAILRIKAAVALAHISLGDTRRATALVDGVLDGAGTTLSNASLALICGIAARVLARPDSRPAQRKCLRLALRAVENVGHPSVKIRITTEIAVAHWHAGAHAGAAEIIRWLEQYILRCGSFSTVKLAGHVSLIRAEAYSGRPERLARAYLRAISGPPTNEEVERHSAVFYHGEGLRLLIAPLLLAGERAAALGLLEPIRAFSNAGPLGFDRAVPVLSESLAELGFWPLDDDLVRKYTGEGSAHMLAETALVFARRGMPDQARAMLKAAASANERHQHRYDHLLKQADAKIRILDGELRALRAFRGMSVEGAMVEIARCLADSPAFTPERRESIFRHLVDVYVWRAPRLQGLAAALETRV